MLELGNLARLTSSKTKHSGDETLKRTCKSELRNAIVTVMQKKKELPPCGQIWFPIHKIRLPQLKLDLEGKTSRKIWLQESKPHTKRHWTQEPEKKKEYKSVEHSTIIAELFIVNSAEIQSSFYVCISLWMRKARTRTTMIVRSTLL